MIGGLGTLMRTERLLGIDELLALWSAESPVIRAFCNDFTPTETAAYADFVQPTGAWHTPIPLITDVGPPVVSNIGQPHVSDGGYINVVLGFGAWNWAAAGGATSETIQGWFIAYGDNSAVIAARRRPEGPKVMATVLDTCPVWCEVSFPPMPGG